MQRYIRRQHLRRLQGVDHVMNATPPQGKPESIVIVVLVASSENANQIGKKLQGLQAGRTGRNCFQNIEREFRRGVGQRRSRRMSSNCGRLGDAAKSFRS